MTERRTGRHRPARQSRKVWPIVVGVLVLCAAAGGTAWGLSRGGSSGAAPSPAATTTRHTSSEAAPPPAPATSSASPVSSATTSTTTTPSAALRQLTECRAALGTGQRLVAAADQNYADWSAHVYAQTDYDKGKITFKQAQGIWDRTKKAGPGDLKKYGTAKKAWDKADHKACTGLKAGDGAAPNVVKACGDRSAAMLDLIAKAGPVYTGWKGHQIQMTHTEEKSSDPDAYFKEWFGRVHHAEQPLAAYKKAQTAYRKSAACPTS